MTTSARPDAPTGVPFELRDISKRFGVTQALAGVSLTCLPGEVHGLIGANGAGKSTLMGIATGVLKPDAGSIWVWGEARDARSVGAKRTSRIAAVYQELSLTPHLDVAHNIFLAREPASWGFINRQSLYSRATDLLGRFEMEHISPRTLVSRLTIAQRQIVEIARAIGRESDIVFLDEPTSSLTSTEAARLFGMIAAIRDRQGAVVYVSHRLDEVIQIADRVTVLRGGQVAGMVHRNEMDHDRLVDMMVGRSTVPTASVPVGLPTTRGEVALEVSNLIVAALLEGVDLKVRAGEIVVLAGLVGAGRSSLLRTLFGLLRYRGVVRIRGVEIMLRSPRDAIAQGIGFIPEDRKLEGIAMTLPVQTNLISARIPGRLGLYNRGQARRDAQHAASLVALNPTAISRPAALLSGGNQQKAVLGKWLRLNPSILLCDEPTRGVDPTSRTEIYGLLRALADRGTAILAASSDVEEILVLADRIVVMRDGRVNAELDGASATEEEVIRAGVLARPSQSINEPGSVAR